MADALVADIGMYGDRAYFGEVLPHHVHGPAADHDTVVVGDPELLYVLVERDRSLVEQYAGIFPNQVVNRPHVRRASPPYRHVFHSGSAYPLPQKRRGDTGVDGQPEDPL